MFLIMIAYVTRTSMGMAFLFSISPISVYAYMAASMVVYLLYRVCRRDLHYWIQIEGKTGRIVSILSRVTVKIIADFTGCMLGELYYSLALLQAQVRSAVVVKLYVDATKGGADALVAEIVYTVVATASMTWACSYSLFFAHIKKGYAGTFVDTRSAAKFLVDAFNDPKASDYQKAEVARNTRLYWRSIEDEMLKFLAEKWTAWEEEKPKFFTKAWIAKLHDDMLPERVLAERRRGGRRRSSNVELLLGAKENGKEDESAEDESAEDESAEDESLAP